MGVNRFFRKLSRILLLLLFASVLSGGGGSSGTGGKGGLLTIASGVLMSAASMPISGALVSFPDSKHQAVTNAKGEFQISDKQPKNKPVALQIKVNNSQYIVPVEGFSSGEHVKVGLNFDPTNQVINVESFEVLARDLEKVGKEFEEMGDQFERLGKEFENLGKSFDINN